MQAERVLRHGLAGDWWRGGLVAVEGGCIPCLCNLHGKATAVKAALARPQALTKPTQVSMRLHGLPQLCSASLAVRDNP